MGTKRLARTIIEGGRARRNVFERRYSHGQERAAGRDYERDLWHDAAHWEDHGAPVRAKVPVWHHDKLGAPRRWLRAQRGRLWDDVHAEICARFDTRTIAGQHIVFDHLLREVDHGHENSHHFRRDSLHVDGEGRLQVGDPRRRIHRRRPDRETPARLRAWVGERRIGRRGSAWYWFVPTVPRPGEEPRGYRQGARLDAPEARAWEAFSDDQRRALTLRFDADGRRVGATELR